MSARIAEKTSHNNNINNLASPAPSILARGEAEEPVRPAKNMIYNFRKIGEKKVEIYPTPKQNKYLRNECELSEEFGSNYNGYGYADRNRVYILTLSQVREFNKIGKEIKKERKQSPPKQIRERWAKRLSKIGEISLELALRIAEEKEEYKEQQVQMMYDRQCDSYSERRKKLINKMERENPLRRIEDEEHAEAILSASRRHTESNYEDKLEEAREEAMIGTIDRSEVKEYARREMQ